MTDPSPATGSDESPDRIELDLPVRAATGDDVVDEALDQVDAARGSGLEEHLRAAGAAQAVLQQRLADTGE